MSRSGMPLLAAPPAALLLAASVACPPVGQGDGDEQNRCPDLPEPMLTATCVESQDCELDQICSDGHCLFMAACSDDCHCPEGRSCDVTIGRCTHTPGELCGPCDEACTGAGGSCAQHGEVAYCSAACDPASGPFCPDGYQCQAGLCQQTWAGTCLGCNSDADCPPGELCNANSRHCQRDKGGPQVDLSFDRLEWYWLDPNDPAQSGPTANLQLMTAIGARGGQNFVALDVPVGECLRHDSTLDYDAPFPLGPALDLGDAITLSSAQTSWEFAARRDSPNPDRNPSYGFPAGMTVDDWLPGVAHTWSALGSDEVGAFTAAMTFPASFTAEPALVAAESVQAHRGQDLTLRWSPVSSAPDTTMIGAVSYNIISGMTVEALVEIVCRAEDGAGQMTIPGALLEEVPTGEYLTLYLQRAAVVEPTPEGVERARISASLLRVGYVIFSP